MGIAFPKWILLGGLALLALALAPFLPVVRAERLPVKTYTITDGLARDSMHRIVRDSRGFLWFCTVEGLSRFDGYRFTNYGVDQGLSHPNIYDLLETRSGDYWIATASGVCRFNPKGQPADVKSDGASDTEPMFVAYFPEDERARWTLDLYEDSAGIIWCATEGGLYRLEQRDHQWSLRFVDIGIQVTNVYDEDIIIYTMVEDDRGALWIGSQSGLFRRFTDGRVERYTTRNGLPQNRVAHLLKDHSGRLWAGIFGLCRIVSEPNPDGTVVDRVFTKKDGLLNESITSIFQTSDGKLWVGTGGGLSQLVDDGRGGEKFRTYTTANGLSFDWITALAEDRDGNLWAAFAGKGAAKISRNGFVTYTNSDGINAFHLYSIFTDQAGNLCLFGSTNEHKLIEWFDGKRFHSVRPNVNSRLKYWGWGSHQNTFQAHTGEWWVTTGEGLYRYPKVNIEQLSRTRPKAVYTTKNGLPSNDIFRLFEDSRGDLWIGSLGSRGISRWERATDTIHNYPPGNSIPLGGPTAFYEDHEGNIWIAVYLYSGLYPNGLIRYSPDRTVAFTASEGLPPGFIYRIYGDSAGRMWLATTQSGLVHITDPSGERPQFVKYMTAQGLSSNDVLDIVEDRWGRLYLATGRGVNRLEVESGRVRHYTVAEGLPNNGIFVAFRDRDGALWFGGFQGGLARLVPELDPPTQPPPIFINGLRIAGVTKRLSELGETEVVIAELGANQNQLQIDFFGLSLAPGELLRYQYRLEGAGEEWSAPADLRTANYPALPPGSYRFLVRAVSADGTTSQTPAAVSFTILRPIWQRWWFVTLAALFLALLVYAVYRYRLTRLLELERVRTRIATDLHDDIGASLSRMAILSEVVKQQTGNGHHQSGKMLTEIAESARGLVDSMSDIVWSIDPRKDDLANVAMRVRQFASDILESQGISWQLEAPPEASRIKLAPEQRRHIYLICKEAINNIARHAACDSVILKIALLHDRLQIAIRDNGRGFQVNSMAENHATNRGGNGLTNMQARAAEAGGALEIHSVPGSGTQLLANLPLKESHTRKTKKPGA
jgi:ligand-binding sensor domain-containing protein/signal transduction histidine kinase